MESIDFGEPSSMEQLKHSNLKSITIGLDTLNVPPIARLGQYLPNTMVALALCFRNMPDTSGNVVHYSGN